MQERLEMAREREREREGDDPGWRGGKDGREGLDGRGVSSEERSASGRF